jgi:aminodeoxyfutalosine deaminase
MLISGSRRLAGYHAVMSEKETVIRCGWLWDGIAPEPVRNAVVRVAGARVVSVSDDDPDVDFDIGPGLLTPGLFNWHSHLELSHVHRPPVPGRFVDWLLTVMRAGPADADSAARATAEGAADCLRFGVTGALDIARHPAAVRAAARSAGLHAEVCGEITGLGPRFSNGQNMLAAASGVDGFAPHACYSTHPAWFAAAAESARTTGKLLTTHLAETRDERLFLRDGTGEFAELWQRLGHGVPHPGFFADGPTRWMELAGMFDGTALVAAHANDLDNADIALLARHGVSIAHCPRTHAYFGRPAFDIDRLRQARVRVVLGTDSAASAGDLNLLLDLRLLAAQHPNLPPAALLAMASLPLHTSHGLAAWSTTTDQPLAELLSSPDVICTRVWTA